MLSFTACMKGKKVDMVVHNAKIHCLDDQNTISQAMAIKDGKIIEIGPERQILNKYRADEFMDCQGKNVYPGFTDAHAHMFYYARQKLGLDLNNAKSWEEVLIRTEKYQESNQSKWIVGIGWDQSLWGMDSMPCNDDLNRLFPKIPVALYRVDGHAVIVNDAFLRKVKIDESTKISGGEIVKINGKCTGLLIDNAMTPIDENLPEYSAKSYKKALQEIQNELFQFGITGVHEAGISQREFKILKDLVNDGKLSLDLYAMLLATEENKKFIIKNGKYSQKNLSIRSIKLFVDGSLGSRGALLKKSYNDQENSKGLLKMQPSVINQWVDFAMKSGYQLNSHAIGDSANSMMLKAYSRVFAVKKDHRWRIEHAQVVDPNDLHYFGDLAIFPSVQPTHATSDQRWAQNRLGIKRMKGAYAYNSLYNQFGMLVLGTDFPIESINPFFTLQAAVDRTDRNHFPRNGFQMEEALSLDVALKGMTIWPQFASFSENKRGNLIKGKEATFFIVYKPITNGNIETDNFSLKTIIRGKIVYEADALR